MRAAVLVRALKSRLGKNPASLRTRAVGRAGPSGHGIHVVLALAFILTVMSPARLTAQSVSLGPQLLLGDYRETFADLHFRGSGFGGLVTLSYKKAAAEVAYGQLSYDPAEDGDAVTGFTAKQFDARVRYYLAGPASVEVGVTSRKVDPEFTAQSAGAARVGVRLSQLVDPAVRLVLRGNYLPAAKFSGGGSASFGLELGMGVSGDFARGRVRLSAEYEFQHFNRRTDDGSGEVAVPIQQAVLRLGVAGAF